MKTVRQIIALALLLGVGGFFFLFQGDIGGSLAGFRSRVADVFDGTLSREKLVALEAENARLRSELEDKGTEDRFGNFKLVEAELFSRYPFNDRSLVLLDRGSEDGVGENMPVVTSGGGLLGVVRSVKRTRSEVQTIFDGQWKSSVEIRGEKAVLAGGTPPRLELIQKGASMQEGDPVLSVSPDFPKDIYVGSLGEVTEIPEDVWMTAEVRTGFLPEDLSRVFVIVDFP